MAGKLHYQYGTSPRKVQQPEYKPRRSTIDKPYGDKTYGKKSTVKNVKKTNLEIRKQKKERKRRKMKIVGLIIFVFSIFLFIGLRTAQINEVFMNVETLKADLALIEKENEQLQVNIENDLNLSAVEQQAKALLGMQKLQNDQKVYINLDKKDYIEPSNAVLQDEQTFFEKVLELFKNIW